MDFTPRAVPGARYRLVTGKATAREGAVMRSAVIYFSVSGNTAKVARAIADALPDEVHLAELKHAPSLEGYDVVFLGMPIHQFGPPEAVCTFLESACKGRCVALFITHAAGEEMPELEPWLAACREAASGCEVVGMFSCQGQVPAATRQQWIDSGVPMLVQFGQMAGIADGQPNEAALERARAFAGAVVATIDSRSAACA
jgi:flavodoxin